MSYVFPFPLKYLYTSSLNWAKLDVLTGEDKRKQKFEEKITTSNQPEKAVQQKNAD